MPSVSGYSFLAKELSLSTGQLRPSLVVMAATERIPSRSHWTKLLFELCVLLLKIFDLIVQPLDLLDGRVQVVSLDALFCGLRAPLVVR